MFIIDAQNPIWMFNFYQYLCCWLRNKKKQICCWLCDNCHLRLIHCQKFNSIVRHSMLNIRQILGHCLHSVNPKIVSSRHLLSVRVGDSALLPCEHYPRNLRITWTHRSVVAWILTHGYSTVLMRMRCFFITQVWPVELQHAAAGERLAAHLAGDGHQRGLLWVQDSRLEFWRALRAAASRASRAPLASARRQRARPADGGNWGTAFDSRRLRLRRAAARMALGIAARLAANWLWAQMHCRAHRKLAVCLAAHKSARRDAQMERVALWARGCTHNLRLKAGVRSHRFSALRCGADYTFDVVALNAQGFSEPGSAFHPHGSCMPLPCCSYSICSVCILVIYCSSADCRIHYDIGLDVNVTERHYVQLWADLSDGTSSLRVLSTSLHSSLVRSRCTTWETSGQRQRRLAAAKATCSTTACVRWRVSRFVLFTSNRRRSACATRMVNTLLLARRSVITRNGCSSCCSAWTHWRTSWLSRGSTRRPTALPNRRRASPIISRGLRSRSTIARSTAISQPPRMYRTAFAHFLSMYSTISIRLLYTTYFIVSNARTIILSYKIKDFGVF